MSDCNLCNAGQIGRRWTVELNMGSKKLRDAALEFNMSIEDVMEHLNSHKSEVDDVNLSELLDDPNFFYQELLMLHLKLKEWLSFIIETEELSDRTMSTGVKLMKETRETLKLVAELQGKLAKGGNNTYQNQYIQIQGDFQALTSWVLENACTDCQHKFAIAMKDKQPQLTGKR